ncbi:hypothetical protein MRX96_049608 [Rhipicephalus microplus]
MERQALPRRFEFHYSSDSCGRTDFIAVRRSPCCGWIPSLARRNSSHRKETSSRLRWTAPSTKNHHGKQRLKCPSPIMWSTE